MNLHAKLTFSDDERNAIKQHLAGKPVKGLATRKEILQLIYDLLCPFRSPPILFCGYEDCDQAPVNGGFCEHHQPGFDDLLARAEKTAEEQEMWANEGEATVVGDGPELLSNMADILRRNELLQARVNRLQHLIDTKGLRK